MRKEKLQIIEIIAVILVAIIFIIGIVFDALVYNGYTFWIVPDLREFSMAVLQIQAGVSTLSVAILALISGMSGHEVYGISITRYYMSDRMQILKQLVVITSAISLVFLGVIFELFELYNLVFASFFCEWVLICFSVISIVPVFGGRGKWKREIRTYLEKNIDSKCPDHKLIVQFLSSCKPGADTNDWNDKQDLIWISLNNLLKENSEESIRILNEDFGSAITAFLRSDDSWEIKRGLTLLQDTYEKIWIFIINNREVEYGSAGPLELYINLYDDCRFALDHLSLQDVEECFDYVWFFENVARVDSYYLKNDQKKYENACKHAEWLSQYMGYLINKKSLGAGLSEYSRHYWGKALKDQNFGHYNVPEESKDVYQLHRCKLYLGYTISLIIDGHTDLIEKCYLESNFYRIRSDRCQHIYRLAVACYLFYLAEVESIYLVPQEAKKCADEILASRDFKGQFTALLEQGEWDRDSDFYQNECANVIEQLLKPYERFKDGQAKRLVIEPTVQLFYIFVQCYIAEHNYQEIPISDDFDKVQSQILAHLDNGSREYTKKVFRLLYERMISTSNNADVDKKADALFDNWEKRIVEQYKNEKVKSAVEIQKEFVDNRIVDVLKDDTREQLKQHFVDTFGNNIDQTIQDTHELRFVLMRFTSDTKYFLQEQSMREIYEDLDGIFVDHVSAYLNSVNAVSSYDRSDKDDTQYLSDMKSAGVDLLIGSEFELRSKDYRNWKEVSNFFEACECIFVEGTRSALAIHKDSLRIAIRDISVSVFDSSLDTDNDVEYVEDTGKYRIKVLNGIAGEFTKEEAEQYIKNQKKVATISVKVTIKTMKPEIGYIVIGTYSD